MKVEMEMPEQRIQDLLTNALEGGSNYWYLIVGYHFPNKCPVCGTITLLPFCEGAGTHTFHPVVITIEATKEDLGIEFTHIELPFKGGFIEFADLEDEKAEHKNLTIEAIKGGVKIMAEKYPRHFGDWIGENDDATTGDVFLQCCLFGEVIYG